MQIKYPTYFIDGSIVPPDYFEKLNKLISASVEAEEIINYDELEDYATKLNIANSNDTK